MTRSLGVLSQGSKGWQKEINLVSWNDRSPKIDIRDWAPEHERMGKGITLNREEILQLRDILNQLNLDELLPD
ncbi:MAG: PC4/YdbC family ssDNA-binding protein [Syntrophomonadaceae bacterium]